MRTYVIYIPGLGDQYGQLRSLALMTWRFWGVKAVHQTITWFDGGDMESKLQMIKDTIDRAPAEARIVLIGESAGATLALHTATRDRRVKRVITLCGVSSPDTPISNHLRREAPALSEAVDTLPKTFEADVHSVRAVIDRVVNKRYSSTADATRHVIWSVGHVATITLCLTVCAPIITTIAKMPKK